MGYNEYKLKHRLSCAVSHMSEEDKRRREKIDMKDFFEDLGKRLGATAETVTNRAGEAIEIQRLKSQIRTLARENAVDLMELGRSIYDRYKAGEEVEESATALCEAISSREDTMEGYEKKISRIRGSSECPNCGKMVARDMAYCPYCGEKAPEAENEEAEDEDATEDVAEDFISDVKEKAADAAETMAEKAQEAADKAGKMAEKAADKAGEMAEKAADKAGEMAEKAADKISEAVNKAAE